MNDSSYQREILLSRKKAAEFLGVCKTTLDRLNIPRTKLRRRVFYRQIILDQWIKENTDVKEVYFEK